MNDEDDQNSSPMQDRLEDQYKRLQKRLDSYGEDDIVMHEEFGESVADVQDMERYMLTIDDSKELLSFYISTAAHIESESALIILAHSFDFGINQRGSLDFLRENLTQSDREDMLYCLGIIDPGLKGELARVRKRRNELAHSRDHQRIDDIDTEKNNVKRAYEALDKLKDIGIEVEMKKV
ncbi:hypothetical protein [Natronoglomus mannanivorans]|uniref:Uncharacterized protein n=1 Tax=Natronoglomus mannanivorans TaxID=2979990 RepID=A0AAP2YX55_9EURY|nr:hypothetical protein [Halobacteria archaeon AArc-xg1-1]